MIYLWYVKIKLNMSELEEVPERYNSKVLEMLVKDGLFDEEGSRL